MRLFCTKEESEWWLGEPVYEEDQSVGFHRMWMLDVLAQKTDFDISLQSIEGYFTKRCSWNSFDHDKKLNAYIIHRTLLNNEIVFDFDAKEYEQNVYNFKCIYPLLNDLGYVPYIYYSGNKGLHVHFYMDYKILAKELDMELQKRIRRHFANFCTFEKRLTVYVTTKLNFLYKRYSIDGSLNHTKHLIRSEGSLNKLGFKTFLGHTPEDIPLIPPIHNLENKQYPKFPFHHFCYTDAKIKSSVPKDIVKICEEFVREKRIGRIAPQNKSLKDFFAPATPKKNLKKSCIKFFESKDYGNLEECRKRVLFILASYYKDHPDQINILQQWNESILNNYLREDMITTTAKSTTGKVGCRYIKEMLSAMGQDAICRGCSNGK